MKTLVSCLLLVGLLSFATVVSAADPDTDWKAMLKIISDGQPRSREQGKVGEYLQQRDRLARELLPLAEAFYAAYPQHPRRWRAVLMLSTHAPTFIARRGPDFATKGMRDAEIDTAAKAAHEAKLARYEAAMDLATDVPADVLLQVHSRQLGNALRAAKEHPKDTDLTVLRAHYDRFVAQHPGTPFVFTFVGMYMGAVEAANPSRVASEWVSFTQSTDERVRKLALEKVRASGVQATVADLRFTAVDGREVDVAKLRGKVVLIDFWATWCVPCIAELPNVKQAYAAYHDRGFEVIGIALDRAADRQKLLDLAAKHDLPWPQYFDGKHWQTEPAVKYAVKAIPAMFLLDQEGKVVSTNARGPALEAEIRRLLKL